MTPLVLIALAKASAEAAKDATLYPGKYPIDETVTVRVRGEVSKGEDFQVQPKLTVPWKAAFILALMELDPSPKGMKANAKRIAKMATRIQPDELAVDLEAFDKDVNKVLDALPQPEPRMSSGAVRHKLFLDLVAPPQPIGV